jgi:UDP-N-acetyl-D-mannosaminuronate dehydrogenase
LTANEVVVVAGVGEVGRPLLRILEKTYECVPVDIEPVEINKPCAVLHICYPFQIPDFIGTAARYAEKYQPELIIINSTVAPGTTRKVQEAVGHRGVAYSPVRGKHARMDSDMLRYKKFVSASHRKDLEKAVEHFQQAGFMTSTFRSPELAELGKLLETTYLGILIGWAQEVERLAARYDGTFEDVNAFVEEIDFLPAHIYPGCIGGHCVLPNIAILQSQIKSDFLDAVVKSNGIKQQETLAEAAKV